MRRNTILSESFCQIKCFTPVKNECFCEFHNGQGENGGILCKRNDTFQKALLCGLDQICAGPSTERDAVNGTTGLCTQGRKYHCYLALCRFICAISCNNKII